MVGFPLPPQQDFSLMFHSGRPLASFHPDNGGSARVPSVILAPRHVAATERNEPKPPPSTTTFPYTTSGRVSP